MTCKICDQSMEVIPERPTTTTATSGLSVQEVDVQIGAQVILREGSRGQGVLMVVDSVSHDSRFNEGTTVQVSLRSKELMVRYQDNDNRYLNYLNDDPWEK